MSQTRTITPTETLTTKQKVDQMHVAMAQMEKESRAQAVESKIQTYALLVMFFLGVATIADLSKKVKNFSKKL